MGEEVTAVDCQKCPKFANKPAESVLHSRRMVLINTMAPGDVLVMSAAIGALGRQHPGKFKIGVASSANAIYEHNPFVQPMDSSMEGAEMLRVEYPGIHKSNQRPTHFMQAYVDFLAERLEVP